MNPAGSDRAVALDSAEFDSARLVAWMDAHVRGFIGPVTASRFSGGQSNPTYKLTTPAGSYVLRRKPFGHLLPGAHAIDREARVIAALGQAGFPVPPFHALCMDESVVGAPFYVMGMVEGRVFWDAGFSEIDAAARPAFFDAMNATIAQLHSLDYAGLGLGDYGRPANYVGRQVSRWSKQYLADAEAGRDPSMDRLIEWLAGNVPDDDQGSIVHGDFRCDNLIFHPTEPRVAAVIDWELSTLGHPISDFAYHAMMYRMPSHIVAGIGGTDPAASNIPTEAEYKAAYCRRTGRASLPNYEFHMTFAFFRIAAIFHGIKGRLIRGTASSAQAHERVKVLPELARLAWEQAQRAGAS